MKKQLKNFYYKIYYKNELLRKENTVKPSNRILTRRQILRNGFTSESYNGYELDKNNMDDYVNDYQQMLTGKINGKHAYILNNKVIFEKVNKDNITIPRTFATIHHGEIMMNDGLATGTGALINFLTEHKIKHMILKPISDSRGNGIEKIDVVNKKFIYQHKTFSSKDFEKEIHTLDSFLMGEFLEQSDFGKHLFPQTINTIRIMTMMDPITNEPFIPAAAQRMGVNDSIPTDNFHRGGLSADIDLDTGVLGLAASRPITGKLVWQKYHPDTGIEIQGLQIPNWENIKSQIINLAKKNPELKYVGWDVVHTVDGISILEGNSWPDVDVFQIHRPLLKDERVKKFYKYYNII